MIGPARRPPFCACSTQTTVASPRALIAAVSPVTVRSRARIRTCERDPTAARTTTVPPESLIHAVATSPDAPTASATPDAPPDPPGRSTGPQAARAEEGATIAARATTSSIRRIVQDS